PCVPPARGGFRSLHFGKNPADCVKFIGGQFLRTCVLSVTPLYSAQAAKYLNSLDAQSQRRIRGGISNRLNTQSTTIIQKESLIPCDNSNRKYVEGLP
ncbi:MAG: hypothetical protein FWF77_01750, partial [Defluviitaleaceae bacterium]|nr:hypothetical protein [Defluviitaleaceae bacterium]